MFGTLFLLFTAVPILELYLLIQVGGEIGTLNTVLLVLLTGVVGAYLARSQGQAVLADMTAQAEKGQLPADSIFHAFLIFAGGLLLLTPGFFTDILGLCMVFPPTRYLFLGTIKAYFKKKMQSGEIKFYSSQRSKQGGFGGGFVRYQTWQSRPNAEPEQQRFKGKSYDVEQQGQSVQDNSSKTQESDSNHASGNHDHFNGQSDVIRPERPGSGESKIRDVEILNNDQD